IVCPTQIKTRRTTCGGRGERKKKKSRRRARGGEGIIQKGKRVPPADTPRAEDTSDIAAYVQKNRTTTAGFDIISGGSTSVKSRKKSVEKVRAFADAGATWWIESVWTGENKLRSRINEGPPRIE